MYNVTLKVIVGVVEYIATTVWSSIFWVFTQWDSVYLKFILKQVSILKIAAMVACIFYTIDFKMVGVVGYQTKNKQYGINMNFMDEK